jgi:hypothetical protein
VTQPQIHFNLPIKEIHPSIVDFFSNTVDNPVITNPHFHLRKQYLYIYLRTIKMKFSTGVTTALLAMGGASAFAPQRVNGARSLSSLSSTAAEPVYTFTKSEEIFAEAQEVRVMLT